MRIDIVNQTHNIVNWNAVCSESFSSFSLKMMEKKRKNFF